MNIKRGDIFLACLDPVVGHELAKTRPVVVVSNDKNNRFSGTVTILPLTSQKTNDVYPFEVFLPQGVAGLPKDSKAKADQIRTIAKQRLVHAIGSLEAEAIAELDSSGFGLIVCAPAISSASCHPFPSVVPHGYPTRARA
jgi:mRNA interferase MazF